MFGRNVFDGKKLSVFTKHFTRAFGFGYGFFSREIPPTVYHSFKTGMMHIVRRYVLFAEEDLDRGNFSWGQDWKLGGWPMMG